MKLVFLLVLAVCVVTYAVPLSRTSFSELGDIIQDLQGRVSTLEENQQRLYIALILSTNAGHFGSEGDFEPSDDGADGGFGPSGNGAIGGLGPFSGGGPLGGGPLSGGGPFGGSFGEGSSGQDNENIDIPDNNEDNSENILDQFGGGSNGQGSETNIVPVDVDGNGQDIDHDNGLGSETNSVPVDVDGNGQDIDHDNALGSETGNGPVDGVSTGQDNDDNNGPDSETNNGPVDEHENGEGNGEESNVGDTDTDDLRRVIDLLKLEVEKKADRLNVLDNLLKDADVKK